MRSFLIAAYLLSIVLANVLTASFQPLQLGVLIVPVGSFLIGATFILRDLVQNVIGRRKTYATIAVAMIVSAITSNVLGDTLWIVTASAFTFMLSETTDTEIYTRLKLPMAHKVFYSGFVGGIVDSIVFIIIGLSPFGAGVLPWDAVIYAVLGQIIVKTALQSAGAWLIAYSARSGKSRSLKV
ncbi:VUT family protein [Paenibacillus piri]|uniref:VUT family protein n=1 Tax=Paenibacillus piri TaxID=2547395 RepID=A0A4R5KYK7_9BACL|nr:VUT family protein [Paenibacillus piri]TDG00218.1 VUT family protein [Paenibacillus piri]